MRTFSITDVGMVRQVNQDYVYVTDRPLGILQNLFVVADGMGGHQAGDYASKYTVEVLNRELALSEGEDIERCLVGAIKTANREIIKEASRDEHLKGMGTTVVAATISNQMMYFANVGDSRLYLINQGIQQLTKDHSLVEEMVRLGVASSIMRTGKAYAIRRTKEVLRQKQKLRNGSVISGNSRERIWILTLRILLKSIFLIWRTDLEKVRLRINDMCLT